MKPQKITLYSVLTVLFFLVPKMTADVGPTYAIVKCTIVTGIGPQVENGILIIRNGVIESVGFFGKTEIPADAEVIEAEGMYAYPGLIDAHTNILLEPPQPPSETQAARQTGEQAGGKPSWQEASLLAYDKLRISASDIEGLHQAGITTILLAPAREIFAGQSVVLNVHGEDKDAMVLKQPFGLHINFVTARGEYPSSLMGTMALLRQSFLDTQHYALYKSQFEKSSNGLKRPQYDPFLETLVPYVLDEKPVIFNCANLEDIKRAIRLTEEFKLNSYISGANEAWRVSDWLKKANLPLLVSLNFTPPNTSVYVRQDEALRKKAEEEIYPANAKNLHTEGIAFALTSLGLSRAADTISNLRKAIQAGYPEEEALKALTIQPAKYLGIGHLVGTLEPGKIANIVLSSGKIFDEKSNVAKIFVDGFSFDVKKPSPPAKAGTIDISGRWSAIVSSPEGDMDMTIAFIQDGTNVTGSIESDMGTWEIHSGVLRGSQLTFSISATIMGESMEMEFEGTVDQNSLEGKVSFDEGSAEIKATKIPDSDTMRRDDHEE